MRFRLTLRLMNLDELELYKFKLLENFADFGRNNKIACHRLFLVSIESPYGTSY